MIMTIAIVYRETGTESFTWVPVSSSLEILRFPFNNNALDSIHFNPSFVLFSKFFGW